MRLSVIVPTYNRAAFLSEAVSSLVSQGLAPGQMEAVVIDDGSDDGTPDVVKEICSSYPDLQLKYIRQDHRGISAARNRGIRESHGEWIGFLDSDDLWARDKARAQLAYLEAHPEVRIVFTRYQNFRDGSLEDPSEYQACLLREEIDRYFASALVHRSLFEKNGLFCEYLRTGEDTEWLIRSRLLGDDLSHRIPDRLYLRRVHGANITLKTLEKKEAIHQYVMLTALRMASLARNRLKREEALQGSHEEPRGKKEET